VRKILLIALTCLIPSANAGVYYYPNYQRRGIQVRCQDGFPKHMVELKSGKGMYLEGNGDKKYEYPTTYLFPEPSSKKFKYFPSTAGTKCSYRKLTRKEKNNVINAGWAQCIKDAKNCYGMN